MFDELCEVLHREMAQLEEKYAGGKVPMNGSDLEHIDKMAHALKCLATYEAMKSGDYARRSRNRYGYDEYRRY